ncbi:MAG: hypothetical protein PHC51_13055, partial [bacterium]|nr:hypothetical protein [bacterium]
AYALIIGHLVYMAFKGKKAENNPYKSLSLEWSTQSPPIHDNFETIPVVTDWSYSYGKPKDYQHGNDAH